ncbi:hypothetical protein [Sulfuricurvum sp.]|uniref:hypothetical protein n=1 Tax=Sulfuricurvum sp. TaxID=2025608 RepID=UPI0035669A02
MDDRGDILSLEEVKALPEKRKEKFREIPEKDVPMLQGMNRHQRRKWYKENKDFLNKVK